MKLSDAILKGCEMRPEQTYEYFYAKGASCALGAAAEAIGTEPQFLSLPFPELDTWKLKDCPENKMFRREERDICSLWHVLIVLNDELKWPREKSAKWLKGYGL